MRNIKQVDPKRRRGGEDLGRIMERENITSIYNMKIIYFNKRKKRINCDGK